MRIQFFRKKYPRMNCKKINFKNYLKQKKNQSNEWKPNLIDEKTKEW
jgi:hypothetical protein